MGLPGKSMFCKVILREIHVVLTGSSGRSTENQRRTLLHMWIGGAHGGRAADCEPG